MAFEVPLWGVKGLETLDKSELFGTDPQLVQLWGRVQPHQTRKNNRKDSSSRADAGGRQPRRDFTVLAVL